MFNENLIGLSVNFQYLVFTLKSLFCVLQVLSQPVDYYFWILDGFCMIEDISNTSHCYYTADIK